MKDAPRFTRSQLVAISGAPEDAVTFWLRNGLLGDSEREARKHRRFSEREVKLAALLKEARAVGLNVGAMRAIVAQLRAAFALRDAIPVADRNIWDASIIDDPAALNARIATVRAKARERGRKIPDVEPLTAADIEERKLALPLLPSDREREELLYLALAFDGNEAILGVHRSGAGEWQISRGGWPEDLPAPSLIAFDVGKIVGALRWPEAE